MGMSLASRRPHAIWRRRILAGLMPLAAVALMHQPGRAVLISVDDQSWDIGTVAGSWVEPPPQPRTNNLLPESETAAMLRDQQWWGSSDLAFTYANAYLDSGEATTALFAFSVNPSATGGSAFVSAWQVQNGQLLLTEVNTLSSPGSLWAVVSGSGSTYASSSADSSTSTTTTELSDALRGSGTADVPSPLPLLGAGFAIWWLWRPSRRMSR
jgi:hypothetical protein